MNAPVTTARDDPREPQSGAVFDSAARSAFAAAYPETSIKLTHGLRDHSLLTLDALARMAARIAPGDIEYNRGDLPTGIAAEDVPANGLSIGDTIRTIDTNGSWMVIKFIEKLPEYRALLLDLLGELEPSVSATTGEMLTPQGFIFLSSPGSMTPFHFDPEHNILLQLRGNKTMTVFPPGDERFADPTAHETYHRGGPRNLAWAEAMANGGNRVELAPGEAVYVPVMAPHFVRNGDAASVSLSITWRSQWSYQEADARCTNALLRRIGLNPAPPPRWPRHSAIKANLWRAARRLRLVAD